MISFIRAFPNGSRCVTEIDRPAAIQFHADRFLARGGRYLIAKLSENEVKLVAAVMGANGEVRQLVSESVANGPWLVDAVDRIVRKSARAMDSVQ